VDAGRLADTIGGPDGAAPVVRSDGRQHPVTVRWWPPEERNRPEVHVAGVVMRALAAEHEGDVLVFLPGAAEIDRTARALRSSLDESAVDVRPVYGALPVAEQDRALAPSLAGRRRVVLATDIAESSLTVAGVRIVVDAGLVRSPRFDPGTGLTRLTTTDASRAAADQRAGRAGRLGPGVAHRLWAEGAHARRRAFPEPEVAVVDLAGAALEVAVWGSGVAELPFLDPPPARAWDEAVLLLQDLDGLDADGRPTPTGQAMVHLPLHPRLARMVVDGHRRGLGWPAVLVAAVLDDRDVFGGRRDERPADLAERVAVLVHDRDPRAGDHQGTVNRDAVRSVGRRARELARRVGTRPGPVDPAVLGPLVAEAYPDRIAQARGGGRFRLRGGGGGWLPDTDPLAAAPFLAVADLDVGTGDGRIRTAAVLDLADVLELVGDRVEVSTTVMWHLARNDLRRRTETHAGALVLGVTEGRAEPGELATAALVERVRATAGAALPWTDRARTVQARLQFLHRLDGERWPDVSDAALLADLDRWLAPHVIGATGRKDLDGIDLVRILRADLDHHGARDLDRLAPVRIDLSNGRHLSVAYDGDSGPTASARVQDLYGTARHPTVVDGRVPVVLHLLSPAGRSVQVTADLPGFWAGSWTEVRKEMAGRYPKHDWPADPATAVPRRSTRGQTRRR
nr:ATP-dependent helicase HrpB [Acidimicrobiia bacterium]